MKKTYLNHYKLINTIKSSYFDKIDEDNVNNASLDEILIDNHTIQDNKGKILANYRWNMFLDFVLSLIK